MRRISGGFTLIELIIVITLMGSMLAIVGAFMNRPFQAYEDQSNRSKLVTVITSALINMKRDVSNSVPNSLRVISTGTDPTSDNTSLEMLNIYTGGRYRYTDSNDPSTNANALSPGLTDSSFNVLGTIKSPLPTGSRMIVNPLNTSKLYAAALSGTDGIITPDTTTLASSKDNLATNEEYTVTIDPVFQFDLLGTGSRRKRFYISDTPITYRCDMSAGEKKLTRYRGYSIVDPQNAGAPTGATASLILENLNFCEITYDAGTATRSGVVTITLGTEIDGESLSMVQQLQVSNAP
jgi:MSHA biogenesis protein MshO